MDDKTKKYINVLENTIEIDRFAKKWTYYAKKSYFYVTWPKLFFFFWHAQKRDFGYKGNKP